MKKLFSKYNFLFTLLILAVCLYVFYSTKYFPKCFIPRNNPNAPAYIISYIIGLYVTVTLTRLWILWAYKRSKMKKLIKKLSKVAYSELQDVLLNDTHYFSFSEKNTYLEKWKELASIYKNDYYKYKKYFEKEKDRDVYMFLNNFFNAKDENIRKEHNNNFVSSQLESNKTFFDTVLKYPLDNQQRESIVKLEDNCLVISSAGSGKTSTIIGKTRYLVEKRNIAPSKILILTFTRKAAGELKERLESNDVTCSTFHSLAFNILSFVNQRRPTICGQGVQLNLFYDLLKNDTKFLSAINNYIINLQSLMGLEHDYDNSKDYFSDRKKYGIAALFCDMDGRIIFTRSEEEKRLCSFLTINGVDFRYEERYEKDTTSEDKRQYKPDFTIYYNVDGVQKHLYLEHFAIDKKGKVPIWFGKINDKGYARANSEYNEGIIWKRYIHAKYGTTMIETKSAEFHDGTIYDNLKKRLIAKGVTIKERSEEEIYEMLVRRSRSVEKAVFTLIQSFVSLLKANELTFDSLLNRPEKKAIGNKEKKIRGRSMCIIIMQPFYEKYQNLLKELGEIDYTDAVLQATSICKKGLWKNYDYILVDEFQDISVDRFHFLQALRTDNPLTKMFCVGDDWQSIYRFAGSDMSLFHHFENFFGYTERCKIETTYRFGNPLIDKSSSFIQNNPNQEKKTVKPSESNKDTETDISFRGCSCDDHGRVDVMTPVKDIIETLPGNASVIILGRYNYDVQSLGVNLNSIQEREKVKVTICGREIQFMSVHSAKGLEADYVILINCNQGIYGFPSLIADDPVLGYVLSEDEQYENAEERRLFYVAVTRAKKHTYVLFDEKRPSTFIKELRPVVKQGEHLCPLCSDGKVILIKSGMAKSGNYIIKKQQDQIGQLIDVISKLKEI